MAPFVPLRLEISDSEDVFARRQWDELLSRIEGHQMASSPLWLSTWWRVYGGIGGRRLRLALFWRHDELVGFAPLVRRWRWGKDGLPFRRMELLGTGEPEEHEIATDYGGIIAAPGFEGPVAHAFAAAMEGGEIGTWDELAFRALDASSPMISHLSVALEARGLPVRRTPLSGSPYIPLPSTFEAYLGALSSSSRYFVRRSLRDFEAWSGGRAEIRRARTEAELVAGQEILMSSHAERWGAEGRAGVFASPYFRSFHRQLMKELLARQQLDLRWLVVDGRPLAALYNYVYRGRVHFYQAGRVLDLPKNVRPGIVLHVSAIEDAIAAGHREYDFLAGSSRYKMQLALEVRPMADLAVERPGLRRAISRAARSWKTWASAAPLWLTSGDLGLSGFFDGLGF